MAGKINHVAILSQDYTRAAKFYEVMFAMTSSPRGNSARAITVGDGYVGLNINPRNVARPARLDHFGIEVPSIEETFERMRHKFPDVEMLQRPSSRPYAGITTHDPDGNVFDLSQKDLSTRVGVYAEEEPLHDSFISHLAVRTMNAPAMADFYAECFDLQCAPRRPDDANYYLSDGHLTLVLIPWHITDYAGTGIASPCLDHLGFVVPSVAQFTAHAESVASLNRQLAPFPVGSGPEGQARLELARRNCALCGQHLADVDGVLLSVSER